MARLVVNPSSPDAWEIQLKPGTNLIGRGFSNDFKLSDPSVSGSHCQVTVSEQRVVIKDLGSTNGTYVNRTRVQEAVLQSGQTIHLGGVVLVFYSEGPTAPGAHAAPGDAKAGTGAASAAAAPVSARIVVARPTGGGTTQPKGNRAAVAVAAAPVSAVSATPGGAPARTTVLPSSAIPVPTVPALAHATAAASPPASPAEAPALLDGGPHPCKSHPKTQARFACNQCREYFCELCVTSRQIGGVPKKFCRHCGAECVPLRAPVIQRPPGEKGFFGRLPGAFAYPLRGSGVMMLLAGTLIFALLNWLTGGTTYGLIPNVFSVWRLVLQIVALGYLFAYLQSIIHSTATEEKELPPLPTASDFWSDILVPAFQLIGLTLFCFAPAIALSWYAISNQDSSIVAAIIATFVLGGLYLPMAFLAVAMLDSVMAANPLQVVPSILKAPLEYLVTVIILGGVFALRAAGNWAIPLIFPRGIATHNMVKLTGYLGAQAFWGVVSMYLLVVGFHILGLVYVSKKEKLGWLGH